MKYNEGFSPISFNIEETLTQGITSRDPYFKGAVQAEGRMGMGMPSSTAGSHGFGPDTPVSSKPIDERANAATNQRDPAYGPDMRIGHPPSGQAMAAEGLTMRKGASTDTAGTV